MRGADPDYKIGSFERFFIYLSGVMLLPRIIRRALYSCIYQRMTRSLAHRRTDGRGNSARYRAYRMLVGPAGV